MHLARLRVRAALRMRLRQLASVRGVLSASAIVLFVGFVVQALHGGDVGSGSVAHPLVRDETLLGLALLVGCLLSVLTSTRPALHFSRTEMDVLFAAPVRRHVLVLYKSLSYLAGALLSAALIAALLPSPVIGRAQLFVAVLMVLMFVQLFGTCASMAALLLRRRWSVPSARVLSLVCACALALTLASTVRVGDEGLSADTLSALASRIGESVPGRILLAPFTLFAGLALPAGSAGDYALRLALATSVSSVLLAAIVRFDASLEDEVSSASLAAHARWRRILSGGSVWQRGVGRLRSRSVPRRPRGIAPIAWAQMLRMLRTAPSMAAWLLVIALGGGISLGALATASGWTEIAALLFFAFVFMLPKMLVFDFRGAPQSIELLKSLPVPARAVCTGQLATPVLFVVALQWTMIGAALPLVDEGRVPLLLALGVLLVPFDVLHYALENLVFLAAPGRLVPVGRMDFDFLGRTLLEFLIKCTLLMIAAGAAVAAGVACLSLLPAAPALAVAVAFVVLGLQAVLAVGVLAVLFTRFDSARHGFA